MRRRRKNVHKINRRKHNQERIQRIVIFAITLTLLFLFWRERKYLYRFEHLGYFGLFAFNVLSNATVFLPLPSFVTVFVSGAIWNPLLVGVISGLGNGIGELVGFFLGYGGRGFINNLGRDHKSSLKRLEGWFRKSGFLTVFIASVLPDPLFDLVGILAGTLNYSVVKFFLATTMGRVVRNIIIAWSGAKIIP